MRKKSHVRHPHLEGARAPVTGTPEEPEAGVPGESDAGTAAAADAALEAAVETVAAAPPEAPAPAPEAEGSVADRLERELAEQNDRLLRTAADFDNFRKRAARERGETWGRAQADVVQRVLDVIDDLGRVAHLDPAQTSADALHEGMGLVEKKLLKVLEGLGLERIDPSGQVFDPNAHEAVMTTPAPAAELDGHVSSVFQAGYRLNGSLLRPARVAVHAWAGPAAGGEAVN